MAEQQTIRTNDSPLHHGFLIHDVSRLRRVVFDLRMRPLGITRAQWWVLTNLSRNSGSSPTQVELARWLEVGKGSLGRLIDRLERSGFIVRTCDPVDRRSKRITVSQRGKALVKRMESIAIELNESCMAGISVEEQQVLVGVLGAMKRNLYTMEAASQSESPQRYRR